MRKLLLLLLICLGSPLWAELRFKQIGAPVVSESGVLSCWLVEGGVPSPAMAIKIVGVGEAGECNVLLDATGVKLLQELCQKAAADRSRLSKGQIVLIGSIPSAENKLDVAILRPDASVIKMVVAHEGQKEKKFLLTTANAQQLSKLLDQALKSIS